MTTRTRNPFTIARDALCALVPFALISSLATFATSASLAFGSPTHLYLPLRQELLLPCESFLTAEASDYTRGLVRRFGNFTIIDDARAGHHVLQLGDQSVSGLEIELPDLQCTVESWPRELWTIHKGTPQQRSFWYLETGYRKLFEDGERMHAVASAPLLNSNATTIRFTSSAQRVRDLERLNTVRWACHSRVMQRYRDHAGKARYLGPLDFHQFRLAVRKNLNVDVFAVSDRFLPWDADHDAVLAAVRSTTQITYDRPYDPTRINFDGLLIANGEESTAERHLPHFERLDPERKDDYVKAFWQSYGHLNTCEVTRHINTSLPEPIVDRLIYQVFKHARDRGCQIMFASVDPVTLRRFRKKYGFERDRGIPTLGSVDESLAYLRVNSQTYFTKLEELRLSAAAADAVPAGQ